MSEQEEKRGQAPKARITASVKSWVRTLIAAAAIALFINHFLIANACVISGSMEDTVMTGSRVFCSRLAYLNHEPERYDIILFWFDQGGEHDRYFKRVIGLPGETVEVVDGKVYIDGAEEPLDDSFVRETPTGNYGPFTVPKGEYFLLGDNRNASYDSKNWEDPFISADKILGKAVLQYFPSVKLL